ncbi:hypothetical protein D3C72_1615960 [compost metagenome]
MVGLCQRARQIGGGDGHTRIRIGDVVRQLIGRVHGVDGHHHCIGAQNGIVRQHQLRAVLHQQDHAVAPLHTLRMQVRRQPLGDLLHLPVGDDLLEEHQGRVIGVAPRVDRQVVPYRSLRHRQPRGHAPWPVARGRGRRRSMRRGQSGEGNSHGAIRCNQYLRQYRQPPCPAGVACGTTACRL